MFRFGMFALEQFKTVSLLRFPTYFDRCMIPIYIFRAIIFIQRLHEWPQYCSHIVQIPHLKDHYADLVTEIEVCRSKR